MNKFIYILLSTCIVILFFLYIFKPAPPVPPVPTPVVVDTWPAKVDSFNTVIHNLNNQVDSMAKKLASVQQQKPQVESFTVDQHIAYFGELTGDTTLEMRLKDSVVLTPIACIVQANTIMADGIQAEMENKMYEQLVLVQKGLISSQAQMIQESNKKVELQKKENQELIQENIAVNKELDKTIHKKQNTKTNNRGISRANSGSRGRRNNSVMRPRDIAARELERLELKHNGNTLAMARDLFSEYPGLFKSVLATRAILRRVKEKTPVYHQITPERESRIKELENMLELCHTAQTKIYDITLARRKGSDNSVAIGLLGDAHIDAVVKKESVAGLNEV